MFKDLSDTVIQTLIWFLVVVDAAYLGYQAMKMTKNWWM